MSYPYFTIEEKIFQENFAVCPLPAEFVTSSQEVEPHVREFLEQSAWLESREEA